MGKAGKAEALAKVDNVYGSFTPSVGGAVHRAWQAPHVVALPPVLWPDMLSILPLRYTSDSPPQWTWEI